MITVKHEDKGGLYYMHGRNMTPAVALKAVEEGIQMIKPFVAINEDIEIIIKKVR